MPDPPRSKVKVKEEDGYDQSMPPPFLTAVSNPPFPGESGRSRESTIVGDTVQPRYAATQTRAAGVKPLTYAFGPRSQGHPAASKVPETSFSGCAGLQSSQSRHLYSVKAPHRQIPVPEASFLGPPATNLPTAMASAAHYSEGYTGSSSYPTGTQGPPNTGPFHGFGPDSGRTAGSAPVASLYGRHQPGGYYNDGNAPSTSDLAHSAGHYPILQANATASGLGPASGPSETISGNAQMAFFTDPSGYQHSYDQRFIGGAPFPGPYHGRTDAPGIGSYASNTQGQSFAPTTPFSGSDYRSQLKYRPDQFAGSHPYIGNTSGPITPLHGPASGATVFASAHLSGSTQGDGLHASAPRGDYPPETANPASARMTTIINPSSSNAEILGPGVGAPCTNSRRPQHGPITAYPVGFRPNSASANERPSTHADTEYRHPQQESGALRREHTLPAPVSPPTDPVDTGAEMLASFSPAPQSADHSTYISLVVPPPSPSPDCLPRAHSPAAEAPSDWVPNFTPVTSEMSQPTPQPPHVNPRATPMPVAAASASSPASVASDSSAHPKTALGKRPARNESLGQRSPNKRQKSVTSQNAETYIILDDDDEELKIVEEPKNNPALQDGITEVLASDGKLILVVGPQKREFQVCEQALFRHSSVLRAAHGTKSPVLESGETRRKIVLPDVDASVMHVLLLVIHAQAVEPRYKINKALFSKVLVIAHHYDSLGSLALVGKTWQQKTFDKCAVRYEDLADQLWIAHQLGYLPGVKMMMKKIIPNARLNDDGEMVAHGTANYNTYDKLEALNLISMMPILRSVRAAVVGKLLEIVAAALDRLELIPLKPDHLNAGRQFVCRADKATPAAKRSCDLGMLGAFRAILRSSGWEFGATSPEGVLSSPKVLHSRIETLAVRAVTNAHSDAGHKDCEPFGGRFVKLDDVVSKAVDLVAFDRAEFRKRAKLFNFKDANTF